MNINTKAIVSAVGSLALGIGAGYAIGYFTTKAKFRKQTEEEIRSVKDYYKLLRKEDYPDPADAVADLLPSSETPIYDTLAEEYAETEGIPADFTVEGKNPPAADPENEGIDDVETPQTLDYKTQLEGMGRGGQVPYGSFFEGQPIDPEAHDSVDPGSETTEPYDNTTRNPDYPYVIPIGEWMDGAMGYRQVTVTFWQGDNTLADERDQVIQDVEGTVGTKNMDRFGQDSEDENMVFIRNEKERIDYEVIQDLRSYNEVVLELPEKANPGVRKMREDDEE